jgi:shikimate dehydrogenase
LLRKGQWVAGAKVLIVGAGGVGSAIAASLAGAGARRIALYDDHPATSAGLGNRLKTHYPMTEVRMGSTDPAGFDIVVNATPLGMRKDDPLPLDVSRLSPTTFVGEVVMKEEITPFLAAARERGCAFQVGTDMLFEQIPAYLEFFGFPTTSAEYLRSIAQLP